MCSRSRSTACLYMDENTLRPTAYLARLGEHMSRMVGALAGCAEVARA